MARLFMTTAKRKRTNSSKNTKIFVTQAPLSHKDPATQNIRRTSATPGESRAHRLYLPDTGRASEHTGSRQYQTVIMPSMRQSYTVTVPEEPPASAFPFLKQEMRRKSSSMSGSVLVSTFVGLLINQAKVKQERIYWHQDDLSNACLRISYSNICVVNQ